MELGSVGGGNKLRKVCKKGWFLFKAGPIDPIRTNIKIKQKNIYILYFIEC